MIVRPPPRPQQRPHPSDVLRCVCSVEKPTGSGAEPRTSSQHAEFLVFHVGCRGRSYADSRLYVASSVPARRECCGVSTEQDSFQASQQSPINGWRSRIETPANLDGCCLNRNLA